MRLVLWVAIIFQALSPGCASIDIDIHYRTQAELTEKYSTDGRKVNGWAKWTPISCDIYIITPEEFGEKFPGGYTDFATGEQLTTWQDLLAHEKRHCDDGYFHP